MQPSLRTRLRWRLEELRHLDDRKVIVGLLLFVALTFGGFFAARTVARASTSAGTRVITVRQRVRLSGGHGHVVTHWRLRTISSQAQTMLSPRVQTVLQTQTIQTPSGVRLVTRPVTHYRVVYRKQIVTAPGEPQTITRQRTDTRVVTVTHKVTVVATITVVSTKTDPVSITVTAPLP